MTGRYLPTVNINGTPIPASLGSELVALSGLELVWGRHGLWDPNEPGQATIDVLDEVGDWVSDPSLFQAPVLITTSEGILFRGFVDKIELSTGTRLGADGGDARYWQAHISASDPLAILARTSPPGVHASGDATPPYLRDLGDDYWGLAAASMAAQRIIDLRVRIAEVTDATANSGPSDVYPPGKDLVGMPRVAAGEDLYTMLQRYWASRIFKPSTGQYRPDTHTFAPVYFAPAGSLVLAYQASQIVTTAGTAATITAPSNMIEVDPAATLSSTISSNVTSVAGTDYAETAQYEVWRLSSGSDGYYTTTPKGSDKLVTPPGMSTTIGRTSFDSKAQFQHAPGTTADARQPLTADLAAMLKPYIEATNGKFYAPPLTFDLEKFDYGPTVEAALLKGYDLGSPWAFPGSVWEPLTAWGPFFQMVGAVMRYEDGWRVTGNFAPAAGAPAASLPINALVTTATPTFDQYAPYIALSTLGTVSGGI